jgi:hypothetical protein
MIETLSLLNKGQQAAVEKLDDWWAAGDKCCLLEADAGFGKSWTVKYWLNKNKHLKPLTVVSAPTHYALEQIIKDIPGVSGSTVASLLGFRPSPTETENQVLVNIKYKDYVKPINFKLIIIDEAFYVPQVLINQIVDNYGDKRFLFLGDRKQLASVGESQSALIPLLPKLGRFQIKLTENMRTSCEIQKQLVLDVKEQGWSYDFGHVLVSKSRCHRLISNLIEEGNLDFSVIAYRNKVVDFWAREIREMIYGYSSDTIIQPGETIRLSAVVNDEMEELIRNNERVKVVSVDQDNQDNPRWITVRRETEELVYLDLDYQNLIEEAYNRALTASEDKRSMWGRYHMLRRQYPIIKSVWAITGHGSQGSTFDWVFVDLADVKKAGDDKLLLVAVSRSKNLVTCF